MVDKQSTKPLMAYFSDAYMSGIIIDKPGLVDKNIIGDDWQALSKPLGQDYISMD